MKQHNHPIQRSGLTKAIVIALSICSLSSTNKADASQLNTNMFIHALPDKIDTNVLSELDSILDYDRSLFSKTLDEICNNIVGNTMFKLLLTKLPPGQKIKISDISDIQTEPLLDQEGSSYSHRTYTVKINTNVYDSFGIGIPERQYYCIGTAGNIITKRKSIVGSLFHEFTHCLHHIEDAERYNLYRNPESLYVNNKESPTSKIWTSKEERRTISGYIDDETFDPICDHMFDYFDSISKRAPFHPRYSHCGYRSDKPGKDRDNRGKLQKCLQSDKKIMSQ